MNWYFGRDFYRGCGYVFHFGAFKRRRSLVGEYSYRFNFELHVSRKRGVYHYLHMWPAWREVPSVVAEYNRTMRT